MDQALAPAEIERRTGIFAAACRREGLKLTNQRLEIFRQLASTGEHPDAETIFARVRRRLPAVSRDTVYRTLALLEDRGLVRRLSMAAGRARFDGNPDVHHHLVCSECGLVLDFCAPELDGLKPPDGVAWGEVSSVQVQLTGTCADCSRRRDRAGSGAGRRHGQAKTTGGPEP